MGPARVPRPNRSEPAGGVGRVANGKREHRGAPVRAQGVAESKVQSPHAFGWSQCELFPQVHGSMLSLFLGLSFFCHSFYTLIITLLNIYRSLLYINRDILRKK